MASEDIDDMSVPEEVAERLPILGDNTQNGAETQTKVYSRRWYVLCVFCLGCFSQACIWNTWGPITESAEVVFGWKDSTIGMLANYGNIAFLITVFPMCYFVDVKGLRISMIICSFLVMVATCIRCITMESTAFTWLANICAVLNGIGGCVPFAGPAALSSVWFPLEQRATATAVVSFANYFGVASAFVIGPLLVTSPKYVEVNSTEHRLWSEQFAPSVLVIQDDKNNSHREVTNRSELETDIKHLLYLHAGLGIALFLFILIYFPARPPLPPSPSASVKRTDYMKGVKSLVSNGSVWLIVLAYAIPTGILGVWQSVLDVNLKPLGISQDTAGYMGFWQTLAGAASGLVIARFSDIFMKRMKIFLIVLFTGSIATSAWFFILCQKYIPFDIYSLYTACILIGVFVNGGIPLVYEIACETSYPIAEGVTCGLLTSTNNVIGVCFLFVMLIPNIGTSWMNEALLGSTIIALPLLFVFPERYRRTNLDIVINVQPETGDLQASSKSDNSHVTT
ncbi:Solute carrier 49 member 4 [Mactra antiquata]